MKRWQHACSVLILTTGLLPALAQSAPAGTVDGTTNLRAAPDTRAEISGRLPAGEPVILTGRDVAGRWVQVENSAGITGWLPVFALITEADILALPLVLEAEATPDETVQVEAFGRVNVRSAPTVTADVIQACVVTLEPVPGHLEQRFARELQFVGQVRRKASEDESGPDLVLDSDLEEGPEEIESLHYDLAGPALEEYVLGLEPYPRRSGVEFRPPNEGSEAPKSPFAVLKGLKSPP